LIESSSVQQLGLEEAMNSTVCSIPKQGVDWKHQQLSATRSLVGFLLEAEFRLSNKLDVVQRKQTGLNVP